MGDNGGSRETNPAVIVIQARPDGGLGGRSGWSWDGVDAVVPCGGTGRAC